MYAYIEYFIYSIVSFYLETCYQRTCAWEVTKEDSEFGDYTKSYYCHYTLVFDSLIYQVIIVVLCTLIVYMIFFEEKEIYVDILLLKFAKQLTRFGPIYYSKIERLREELINKEKIIKGDPKKVRFSLLKYSMKTFN
jgi:hypothetical protein